MGQPELGGKGLEATGVGITGWGQGPLGWGQLHSCSPCLSFPRRVRLVWGQSGREGGDTQNDLG